MGLSWVVLGFYWDNGKENGNYYNGLYWDSIGIFGVAVEELKTSYYNRETLVFNISPCSGSLTLEATQYLELRDM